MLAIYVLTGVLVSQSFPCLVETREKTCVKSKRFEFVKEGKECCAVPMMKKKSNKTKAALKPSVYRAGDAFLGGGWQWIEIILIENISWGIVNRLASFVEKRSKLACHIYIGFALTNHGITSLKVDSRIDCSLECTAILECKSFNFKMTESLGNNCELNDATRHSSSPSEYKETPGLVYYEASLKVSGC